MNQAATSSDFIPPAMLPNYTGDRNCDAYALSFFNSLEAAQTKMNSFSKTINAAKRYGTHIGEMDLAVGDGLVSRPKASGHVNLHQNEDVLFYDRTIVYHAHSRTPPAVSIAAPANGGSDDAP